MHHFKSDLIYNMEHMRILSTEPSSVILSQTKLYKTWKSHAQEAPRQAEAKKGIVK